MLQWIGDRTRLWRCTVQLARFDSLDFAPPAPVPCQGPHVELRPCRAERRRSLTSVRATPSLGGHAAQRRPRSSVRGRTPKPPRGGHRRCRSHAPREADRARLLAYCSGKQDGGGKLLACCSGGAGQRKEMRLHLPIGDARDDWRG